MKKEEDFAGEEFERFLEKYEVYRIKDDFKERVLTIVIASLGLIAALAWDSALKHLFESLLGNLSNLTEELIYAVVITIFAAAVSVFIAKHFNKDIKIENKEEK